MLPLIATTDTLQIQIYKCDPKTFVSGRWQCCKLKLCKLDQAAQCLFVNSTGKLLALSTGGYNPYMYTVTHCSCIIHYFHVICQPKKILWLARAGVDLGCAEVRDANSAKTNVPLPLVSS